MAKPGAKSDRRSSEARAYRRLYTTAHWRGIRQWQLSLQPLCEWCMKRSRITAATVVHHATPHRGDATRFFAGPFVSLCAPCHDSEAQSIEQRGYSTEIGIDGWPVDLKHPTYADGVQARQEARGEARR